MPDINNEQNAFVRDDDLYNKKTKSIPKPELNVGVDLSNIIIDQATSKDYVSQLNIGEIESFDQVARTRDQIYSLYDTMAEDSRISAILRTYATDSTQANDQGKIVWVESSDPEIVKFVSYLLDTMNVDKYIYRWAYTLIKYGDIYLRLYRVSDVNDDLFAFKRKELNESVSSENKEKLDEAVKIKAYHNSDLYTHYVEMVANPANVFELTKFGKTYAYIQTKVAPTLQTQQENVPIQYFRQYDFRQQDIDIYQPTEFVHGCLEDTTNRVEEKVNIFIGDDSVEDSAKYSYTVRRGQSILHDSFKIWRQLTLLETSILLNRISKSSTVRVIQPEVADMPKDKVRQYTLSIKQMFEQKAAIADGKLMSEYINAGPIENTVYLPKRGEVGMLSTLDLSSNPDPGSLTDLDYFKNKLYASLNAVKQFFCLRGNTPILLLNGQQRTIEYLYNHRNEYIGKGIMACKQDGDLDPTVISDIQLTKEKANFIRVHLDNGKYVDVTPEHRMMLRDGTFIEASKLNIGDSLMPYYDSIRNGRRYVLNNKTGKWRPQYRIVSESVCDIPKGYNVHHKDCVKMNDDFDNLQPMTVSEHYTVHLDMLHQKNAEACRLRREQGIPHGNQGKRAINNGIEMHWVDSEDEIPEGYRYGMLEFTDEHKKKISEGLKGIHHSYNNFVTYKDKCREKSMKTKRERKALGLYDEQYRKHSDFCKNSGASKRLHEAHMSKFPENRIKKSRYVRCLCCKKIVEVNKNDDWYNEYLSMQRFWFCSKDCAKISGGGKLARSYNLLKRANYDIDTYELLRNSGETRPDTYFKYVTLKDKLHYIENYAPECNHKVVNIEILDVIEPAYDITVLSDSHTFALPCGIFVHNCDTDDTAGFSGGESLSLISSNYGKAIKKVQNVLRQTITDIVNLMCLNKNLQKYINKFEIKMQPPTTKEEIDRREAANNQIRLVQDTMGLVSDIEDNIIKLKMLKALLANSINNSEVIDLLQEQIDQLEQTPEEEQENIDFESSGSGSFNSESSGGLNDAIGGESDFNDEVETETETPAEETGGEEELSGDETILPNPSSLDMDFTNNEQ